VTAPFDTYNRNWLFDFRFTDMPTRSFAIEDADGRRIGNVMYYNVDRARCEAEIGISIGDRDYWEQGYGSDALHALTQAVFATGGLRRLYLHTLDWNMRARRAFHRAGFEETGTSWRDGHTFVVMEAWRDRAVSPEPVSAAT
jgi:RimJ/RimL family protein N-acetyltransferase